MFASEVVGDNLIMLDKRMDNTGHQPDVGTEGGHGPDSPPIGDPGDLPY